MRAFILSFVLLAALAAAPARAAETEDAMPAMHHHHEDYAPATLKAQIATDGELKKGAEITYTLSLFDANGKPLPEAMIEERHTAKVHALVVDDSLTDYQHVHPRPGAKDGQWVFSFTPRTDHGYHMFFDVKPKDGAPQFLPAYVAGTAACKDGCCTDETPSDTAKVFGYKATITFSDAPAVGRTVHVDLSLLDADQKQAANLEPLMGAYAHIVGFYEGCDTALHAHPMGEEPGDETARGQAPLSFMLKPEKAGFLKIFVQIRVNGTDIYLPFGVNVEK